MHTWKIGSDVQGRQTSSILRLDNFLQIKHWCTDRKKNFVLDATDMKGERGESLYIIVFLLKEYASKIFNEFIITFTFFS